MLQSAGFVVDVVIVNWNGIRHLPRCLAALARSTISPRVIVVDNASTDGSADYVRTQHPDVTLLALAANHGYAGGANAGLRRTAAPYVMVMNPDVVLADDHLLLLARHMADNPQAGAAQGKLYQAGCEGPADATFALIDSAGHRAARSRMVFDRGQGDVDDDRYNRDEPIFSVCGAAIFLRRAMLEDLAPDGEYFDELFHAYKEDIDLCWRARLLGWDIRYIPAATALHVRGWSGRTELTAVSRAARRHSFRNHYLLILKNDSIGNVLLHLPWIAGWEALRQAHALLRDRALYGVYPELWRVLPAVLRKRRDIMRRRRTEPSALRRWFRS